MFKTKDDQQLNSCLFCQRNAKAVYIKLYIQRIPKDTKVYLMIPEDTKGYQRILLLLKLILKMSVEMGSKQQMFEVRTHFWNVSMCTFDVHCYSCSFNTLIVGQVITCYYGRNHRNPGAINCHHFIHV